jgi:nucleotide-binding universal stress UspA family protein
MHNVLDVVRNDYPDVDVERKSVHGTAHQTLIEASGEADLVVVGSQRRQGIPGLQLGRVCHAVLHHAACPVAVVPEAR